MNEAKRIAYRYRISTISKTTGSSEFNTTSYSPSSNLKLLKENLTEEEYVTKRAAELNEKKNAGDIWKKKWQGSKEMIWRDGDTTYYSKGVTDPDYCVLKFTARTGRYYSNFSSENFGI